MGYDAVMFDMDGLMVDTERLAMDAWLDTCAAFGFPVEEDILKKIIGTNGASIRKFCENHFGKDFPMEKIFSECDSLYIQRVDESTNLAKAGLFKLVSHLVERGIPRGVCSSSTRKKIQYKLGKVGVLADMNEIVGGDEVVHGKPHPEPYLKLADKLGVGVNRCLVLEDSYNGIRSAHAAGADVVMVPDMLEPTDETREMCIAIVGSLEDVLSLV